MTGLRVAAEDYLALRRALGFKLIEAERMLTSFVSHLESRGAPTVTVELALEWATLPRQAKPWWWRQRLSIVRGFARYLQAFDPSAEVPPTGIIYSPVPHAIPYVFSENELTALLRAAGALRPPLRGATYRALVGLLAVTGMRVGEAIALDDDDVEPQDAVVIVRHGKWDKSRELVVHPSTANALSDYRRARQRSCPRPKSGAFFVSTLGTRLHYSNVCAVFRRLVREMDLVAPGPGLRPPRLHDLRHRFAIVTLLEWHRQGVDVQPRLPVLSTYLGHTNPKDTYWYLCATPELLGLAAERLEKTWELLA
ncbi:MAG TPA: tyrosine-type recombinase/integrase [Acidimicrobiales bacterium]|nr:tyrosine-type recombinase/integrase [Acidimicrobiales bacterium]